MLTFIQHFLTFFTSRHHSVVTIANWSPGVRTILRGEVLPCGCLAGEYETWTADIVLLVDARDPACLDDGHRLHAALDRRSPYQLRPHVMDDAHLTTSSPR